jgi:hypothetical protein
MAINPNTNFTAGAVLTADQQNRFPRGVVAYGENTTSQFPIGNETVTITLGAFTAVANRYYRITYYEPELANNSGGTPINTMRIRLSSVSGTVLQTGSTDIITTNGRQSASITRLVTFSAGSTVLVATLASVGNVAIANRGTEAPAVLMVEDVGPA